MKIVIFDENDKKRGVYVYTTKTRVKMPVSKEKPSSKESRKSRLPPTREAEFKTIIDMINDVCIQVRKFAKKYFSHKAVDYEECGKVLLELMESWGTQTTAFATWKEFMDKLKDQTVDESIEQKEGFQNILYICNRAKDFELMIPKVREKILNCGRDHVFKFCQSFIEESFALDIRPILEYEESINTYRNDVESKKDIMNTNILRYGEMKKPFEEFISEGNRHGTMMEDTCVLIVEIAQTLKKWVADDANYPERLLQEVVFNNSYKENLVEDIRQLETKRSEVSRSLERKHKTGMHLARDHSTHKKEKRKLKNSLETVCNTIERLDQQIEDKNAAIDDLKEAIADKTPVSPRYRDDLRLKLDKSDNDLNKLHERKDVMERQRSRLEKQLKQVSDRTYELKVEEVTNRHEREEIHRSLEGIDIEIHSIQERISSIDQKSAVLRRVREVKLSSYTLRRVYKRRVMPAEKGMRFYIDI